MSYEFVLLEIKGLVIIKPKEYYYESGFFMESYTKKDFVAYGIGDEFIQDNHSWSIKKHFKGLAFSEETLCTVKACEMHFKRNFGCCSRYKKIQEPSEGMYDKIII